MSARAGGGEIVVSLLAGFLFGAGLLVSGMSNPAKVLGFLDVFGAWDPSLALVMGGAVGVGLLGFPFATRRARAALGLPMRMRSAPRPIDRHLLAGAAIFGVGWGLVGFCPGPALVALASGSPKAILFVVSMVVGMAAFEALAAPRRSGA